MFFGIVTIITALAISTVAAWFSITGLGALFEATFWGVVIMAAWLEIGKIVATKWVHANWKNKEISRIFKLLLCVFVLILMIITSLGIYGYLSKGHLEQSAPKAGIEVQIQQLETMKLQKEEENNRLIARIDQINKITDKNLETSARRGLQASERQKTELKQIQSQIDENNKQINELNNKIIPLKMQNSAVEAKLGPIKYVAELFGFKDPEVAVRFLIVLIMIAFDPLALSLFIAGTISINQYKEIKRKEKETLNEELLEEKVEEVVEENVEEPLEAHDDNDIVEEQEIINDEPEQESIDAETVINSAKQQIEDSGYFELHYKKLEERSNELNEKQKELINREKELDEKENNLNEFNSQLAKRSLEIDEVTKELEELAVELSQKQKELIAMKEKVDRFEQKSNREKIVEMLNMHPEILEEIIDIIGEMEIPPKKDEEE